MLNGDTMSKEKRYEDRYKELKEMGHTECTNSEMQYISERLDEITSAKEEYLFEADNIDILMA